VSTADNAGRPVAAVILAAGKGKRMKGDRAKVLYEVAGRPLLEHVIDRLDDLGVERRIVVVGERRQPVIEVSHRRGATTVVQEEQLGTAHAFQQALPALDGFHGTVLILCGDTPLLCEDTLRQLLNTHWEKAAAITVLSADLGDPTGYGRVVRDSHGDIERIVEHGDASETERALPEINTAIYALEFPAAAKPLSGIDRNNAQGEFYLTDLVAVLHQKGQRVAVFKVGDEREAMGVNTAEQLEAAESIFQELIHEGRLPAPAKGP